MVGLDRVPSADFARTVEGASEIDPDDEERRVRMVRLLVREALLRYQGLTPWAQSEVRRTLAAWAAPGISQVEEYLERTPVADQLQSEVGDT